MLALLKTALRPAGPALIAAALACLPAGAARADLTHGERAAIAIGGAALLGLALTAPHPRGYAVAPHARIGVPPPPPPPHIGFTPAPRVHVAPRPVYRVPHACVTRGRLQGHHVNVLPQPCLARHGVVVHRLPTTCRVRISGIGWGFYFDCLRGNGWQFY